MAGLTGARVQTPLAAPKFTYSNDIGVTQNVDRIPDYAEANNMRVRMHNLNWGSQQPAWVNSLLTSAAGGSTAAAESLRSGISDRINYYVANRGHRYVEVDNYNESHHTPQYWNVYGPAGVADIYNEAAAAVIAAGGNARVFTNEYNVLQDSVDYYANWYLRHVQEIRDADGEVGGIGMQYSAPAISSTAPPASMRSCTTSPSRIFGWL